MSSVSQIALLNVGTKFEGYTIEKKIGKGRAATVFRVSDSSGKQFAMKVEDANGTLQHLKTDMHVLKEFSLRNNRHACQFVCGARKGSVNYVVMSLVGRSLMDLKDACPGRRLTIGCAIAMGIQMLEGIEDLHNMNFLHRDVKPANFAIGLSESKEIRKVYILDFGLTRKFTGADGTIKKPREAAGFRGTVRYASISCHLQRELCRKDDLESWMYTLSELSVSQLPWHYISNINEVGFAKKQVFYNPKALFPPPCPPQLHEIHQMNLALKFYDAPNYQAIYRLLREALVAVGSREDAPYDWENGGPAAHLLKEN